MDSQPAPSNSTRLGRVQEALRSPEFVTDLIQITKCTVAATLAWWVSAWVLKSPMPFLAPWTALLTVHATVYRSLSRGAQTTAASLLGVAVSFVVGHFLGVHVWTFALAILVGMIGSRLKWLRDEGIAIATTGVFVLGSEFAAQARLLDDRLIEIGVGVLIGLVVNLAVIPPLRDQQAARYVDTINRRMGSVLTQMAEDLETSWDTSRADAWLQETVALDRELASVQETVHFARESERMNPRRRTPTRSQLGRPSPSGHEHAEPVSYEHILSRIAEGISHLRHLTRSVREATYAESRWDEEFREQWVTLVRDAGLAIHDPDTEVEPVYQRLDDLAHRLTPHEGSVSDFWPVYGSLIVSLRHIAVIVDDVASARHAREATSPNPSP